MAHIVGCQNCGPFHIHCTINSAPNIEVTPKTKRIMNSPPHCADLSVRGCFCWARVPPIREFAGFTCSIGSRASRSGWITSLQ